MNNCPMETGGRQRSGAELVFNVWGSMEVLGSPSVRTNEGKGSSCGRGAGFHIILLQGYHPCPSPSCCLGLHSWPLEAQLSSVAPPPVTTVTSSQRSQASFWLWLTGAQLSRQPGTWKVNLRETVLLLLQVVKNTYSWVPEKGPFFSHLQQRMGWGNLNLIISLWPFSFLL